MDPWNAQRSEKGTWRTPPLPGGSLFGYFLQNISKVSFYVVFLSYFPSVPFWIENGPSKRGVNIGSAHAGVCFVRVGRGRLDSLLGSILESFWGPSSPLYSFFVDLGCKLVEKRGVKKDRKKVQQGNPSHAD